MDGERPYHHGDLERALKDATIDLITEKGAAGFSLREVARRAGVSHAAPAHHFGDSRGLLTALAIDGFRYLAEELAKVRESTPDPRERVVRLGVAYVRVGLERPGHFAVVFRHDLIDETNVEAQHWGCTAYCELEAAIAAVRDGFNPALDVVNATRLAWSAMQGLLDLRPNLEGIADLQGRPLSDPLALAETYGRMLVTAFTGG